MTKSIVAIVATVAVLAIGFFAYDVLKPVVSPCDTIFQQTTTSLGSKLEILKAKGEIFIGKEKIQDLTERAQVTAVSLKTCCIVLDAGAVNSDQFLQCQASARSYEQEIEAAATRADEAQAAQQRGETDLVEAKVRAINDSLIAAQQQSQLLQQSLVQLVGEPVTLLAPSGDPTAGPAAGQQTPSAAGGEGEPNNDPQHAGPIMLETWIDSAIADNGDTDFFKFKAAAGNRDIYRVEAENKSTSWSPKLTILDAQKSQVASAENRNLGADLSLSFSGEADADYYVVVGNYLASAGEYRLRVSARNAFDRYEPNDTILKAASVAAGEPVSAGIMDGVDLDYYKVTAPAGAAKIIIGLENRSTTLQPSVQLFDGRKSSIYTAYDTTPGANLEFPLEVAPSPHFYVLVDKNGGSDGDYTLTVRFE